MTVHTCEVVAAPVECAERRLCVASAYPWAAIADFQEFPGSSPATSVAGLGWPLVLGWLICGL